MLQSPVAGQVKQIRRVVVLNDLGIVSSPGYAELDREIFAGLQKSPYKIEFYYESLEVTLFPDEVSQRRFREDFIQKFSDRKPDVIIAVGSASLGFIAELQDKFLRDTPVIFCSIIGKIPIELQPDMHFTGVLGRLHPEETLTAALHMLPDTKHVVVTGGMGTFDKAWEDSAKEAFQNYQSKIEFTYLTNLTMPALLERLKHLPDNTLVYHTAITKDAAGQSFIDSAQSVPLIAGAANAPIFVMDDVDLREGTVGGDLVNWANDGRVAAEMAVKVLNGEKTRDIPIVTSRDAYMFDWRALKRWGIKENRLPPGTIVLYRDPTIWERGRKYFVAGIAIILIQSTLIFGLFFQRARKRRAEADLRKSEERFSKTFRQSPLVVAITRTSDSRFIDVNDSFEEHLGWTRNDVIGRTPEDFDLWVDADQRTTFLTRLRTNGSVRNLEACLRKKNGETRTALVSAELIDVGGEPCTVSVAADITERKHAEEVLSTVSRRLIGAQEKERTRIARELHDDINQRLALLAVKLSSHAKEVAASDGSSKHFVDEIRQEISDLGLDVQALSHRLHSSKLEYLGLAVAAGGFCKEFSERHNVKVVFHYENIPRNLPSEISLSLFRVLQEALQNAVKYSGTRQFEATLEGSANEIHLSVHDSGVGFDPESSVNGHGLGLISMTERLKLVDGKLFIDSRPHSGTTIKASVPLTHKEKSTV